MNQGERFNCYSHLFGLVLASIGAWWLLGKVLDTNDGVRMISAAIFSISTVVVYTASSIFHGTQGRCKERWERIDHCSIYILIAGTFTPFSVNLPSGFFVGMWAAAALGILRELRRPSNISPSPWPYVAMGWVAVIGALQSFQIMHKATVALLLAGALCYSAGVLFYRNRSGYRHAHGIWHLFVLSGTVFHYLAVGKVLI